jgi:hypothetical protein
MCERSCVKPKLKTGLIKISTTSGECTVIPVQAGMTVLIAGMTVRLTSSFFPVIHQLINICQYFIGVRIRVNVSVMLGDFAFRADQK